MENGSVVKLKSKLFTGTDKRDSLNDETICKTVEDCGKLRADVNAVDRDNAESTLLHVAVLKKSRSLVKFLLDNGAKRAARNEEGLTAFELAKQLKCDDLIELFEKHSKPEKCLSRGQFHSSSSMNSQPPVKFEYYSDEQLWSTLNGNSKQPGITIDCRFKCDQPVWLIEGFYRAIDLFGHLIVVTILVDDRTSIDDSTVLNYMRSLKNSVIIQCCSSLNTKVFFKEFERDPGFIDFSTELMDVEEEDFIRQLEDETSFGICLILKSFMLSVSEEFKINQLKSLLTFNFVPRLDLIDYAVKYNRVLAVRFLRLYPVQWSLQNYPIQNMSCEMLAALLKIEFPIPTGDIQLSTDVVDHFKRYKNYLIINAAYYDRQDLVEFLVKCKSEKNYDDSIKWLIREELYNIALRIIRADALYPDDFSSSVIINDSIPSQREFYNFCRKRNQLHDLIGDVKSTLENVIEHFSNLEKSKLYLSTKNESALAAALKNKKFDVYGFLLSQGVNFKDGEKFLIDGLDNIEKFQLNEQIIPFMSQIGEASISYLLSKTKIPPYQRSIEREKLILSCYNQLNKIPEMSVILAVVQYSDSLSIIFDFDSVSTVEVNPMSRNSEGIYYPGMGRIYIGAKGDEKRLLGVIAHELTHLAMQLVYGNHCKPYFRADIVEELAFNRLAAKTSKLTNVHLVIRAVFNTGAYQAVVRNAELIVRVNHMLAMHGLESGEALLKAQVPELLHYYRSQVMKQCQTFICESHFIKMKRNIESINDESGLIKCISNSNIRYKSSVDLEIFLQSDDKRILFYVTTNTSWITAQICQNFIDSNMHEVNFTILNLDNPTQFETRHLKSFVTPHTFVVTISANREVVPLDVVDAMARCILQFQSTKFVLVLEAGHVDMIKTRLQHHVLAGVVEIFGDELSELRTFLDSNQQLFIDKTNNPRLTTINIYQRLISQYYSSEKAIAVLMFEDFLKNYCRYQRELVSGVCKVVVLESVANYDEIKTDLLFMTSKLKELSGKKLIVVTPVLMDCMLVSDARVQESKLVHSVSLNDLTADSIELLLYREVRFQGKTVRMKDVIKTSSYDIVDAETITKLANKEVVDIGKQLPGDESFYLPRLLRYGARINLELVKNHLKGDQSLSDDIAFRRQNDTFEVINLDSMNENHFDELCETEKLDMHWLRRKSDHYICKKSVSIQTGFIKFKKFVDKELAEDLSEDDFIDKLDEHQLVIVSDKAGMGKTTLVTRIAKLLKDKHPSCWVVRVNLNLYSEVLREEANRPSFKPGETGKALDFFVNKLLESQTETKPSTEFEKKLVRQSFEIDDAIIILLDAFDELKNEHQKVITKLVKTLLKEKVKQIWLTTRPHVKLRLEKQFSQLSHTFIPFNVEAQRNFLTEFWKRKLNVEIDCGNKLVKFARFLLQLFRDSIDDMGNLKFTGIPLQSRLLAEAFERDCFKFYESEAKRPSLCQKLNLTNLYDYFINRKFEIFHFDKILLGQSTLQAESTKEELYPKFRKNHRRLSLFTLFDEQERDILLGDNTKIDVGKIAERCFRYGIINETVDGQLQFVHRTFAEYFTAEFIVDNLISKDNSDGFVKFVFCDILADDDWTIVRAFINMLISEKKDSSRFSQQVKHLVNNSELDPWDLLCVATEEANINLVEFILETLKDGNCCDVECDGAAKVFFNAIKLRRSEVIESLMEKRFIVDRVYTETDGSCRTPLCEAVANGDLGVCECLLQNEANCDFRLVKSHNYFPREIGSYFSWIGCTALHVGCMYYRKTIVSMLLDYDADVNATDNCHMTPLHAAAICGSVEIVEKLLKFNADINAVNVGGYKPLCEAIRWQRKEVVECLVNLKEFDVNAPNRSGVTPLHVAAVYGNGDIIQILLDHDANIDVLVDLDKASTADVSSWPMTEVIKKACNYSTRITPLYLARVSGNKDSAAILVDNGADDDHAVPLPEFRHMFSDISIIQKLKERKFPKMVIRMAVFHNELTVICTDFLINDLKFIFKSIFDLHLAFLALG